MDSDGAAPVVTDTHPNIPSSVGGQSLRILVADDDAVSRIVLTRTLELLGHTVVAVADGTAALAALLGAEGPSLAILDWMMPGADGLEVCREIRRRPEPYVYIILLTSREHFEDVVIGLDAGADDFLRKPFDAAEIRARLNSGVRVLQLQAGLARRNAELETQCEALESRGRQLSESESRVGIILAASPVPLGVSDDAGRIVSLNPAFVQAVGYTTDDLHSLADWWPSAYPDPTYRTWVMDTWETRLAESSRTGRPFVPMEVDIRRKDGTTGTFVAIATAVTEEAATRYVISLQDVTERLRSEQARRYLSRAVEQSPTSILITDRAGRIEYVNPRFEQVTGYASAEVLGENPRIFKSGVTPPEVYAAMWKAVMAGAEWRGELQNRRKNGELFWEFAAISGVRDDRGEVSHFIAVKEDVTERKRADAELELHRNHLEGLIRERTADLVEANRRSQDIQLAMDGAGIGIQWVAMETGQLLYVNRCAAEMLGYGMAELLEMRLIDIAPSADGARMRQIAEAASREGGAQFESVIRTRDGRLIPVEVLVHFSAATADIPAHGISFMRDISVRRAAEQALEETRAAAAVAQRAAEERLRVEAEARMESRKMEAVGTLAAGIAHDFNNILGSIIGFAEMTGDDLPDDSPGKRNIGQILSAGFRARDLVNRILAFARESLPEPQEVEVATQVCEVLALLRASLPPSVHLVFRSGLDESSGPVTVLADPTQIAQLVMNLCINAGHAMDEQGTVRVSLDSAVRIEGTPTEHPDELCLTVADTGSGIAPEVLERMFDPFFTTKAPGKGSGLGLSVVYGIVTALGGRIDVQSRADGADRGSSVRVFLPIVPAWSRTGGLRVAHTAR